MSAENEDKDPVESGDNQDPGPGDTNVEGDGTDPPGNNIEAEEPNADGPEGNTKADQGANNEEPNTDAAQTDANAEQAEADGATEAETTEANADAEAEITEVNAGAEAETAEDTEECQPETAKANADPDATTEEQKPEEASEGQAAAADEGKEQDETAAPGEEPEKPMASANKDQPGSDQHAPMSNILVIHASTDSAHLSAEGVQTAPSVQCNRKLSPYPMPGAVLERGQSKFSAAESMIDHPPIPETAEVRNEDAENAHPYFTKSSIKLDNVFTSQFEEKYVTDYSMPDGRVKPEFFPVYIPPNMPATQLTEVETCGTLCRPDKVSFLITSLHSLKYVGKICKQYLCFIKQYHEIICQIYLFHIKLLKVNPPMGPPKVISKGR